MTKMITESDTEREEFSVESSTEAGTKKAGTIVGDKERKDDSDYSTSVMNAMVNTESSARDQVADTKAKETGRIKTGATLGMTFDFDNCS